MIDENAGRKPRHDRGGVLILRHAAHQHGFVARHHLKARSAARNASGRVANIDDDKRIGHLERSNRPGQRVAAKPART
jgi:hypothetical protein